MADTHETIADIIAEMRIFKCCNLETGELELCSAIANYLADRLDAAYKREKAAIEADALAVGGIVEAAHRRDRLESAHKREIDVLKQRCAELNAEVAAKDEVIKRLNDAISEEQRRKMATAEKSSAVGDAAKLREALKDIRRIVEQIHLLYSDYPYETHLIARKASAALAATKKEGGAK